VLDKLKEISGKPYTWYLTELARMEDDAAGLEGRRHRSVRKFMSGPQKGIYDAAAKFMRTQEPNLIAVIRDDARRFEEDDYNRLLSKVSSWAKPAAPAPEIYADPTRKPAEDLETKAVNDQRMEYVPSRSLKIAFAKAWLADEVDVDRYLASMREALLAEIRKGKRIQI
jgi:hypothetical protein